MSKARSGEVKCEGRFSGIRNYLYNEVFPVVLDGKKDVHIDDLGNSLDVLGEDIHSFDERDPYFHDSEFFRYSPHERDGLRTVPKREAISLAPLVDDSLALDHELVGKYLSSQGNSREISENLERMTGSGLLLVDFLGGFQHNLYFPKGNNGDKVPFTNYSIGGFFGIGTIVEGGEKGSGIRSDAPFLLGIYKNPKGLNLAGVVGFWAQDNKMLISQIQSCRNALYPEGVLFGVGSIGIAEQVARKVGFKGVDLYAADHHPIFKEHPDSRGQLIKDFKCLWDCSATKLKYDGSRGTHYSKTF